ncbi:MAG: response regulator [Candidatus Sulfotelmatobacter sp.]|jgi:CheY-like chemotaxis protein
MRPKEKVNVLMVDDQPAKLLTYEAILAELGENLLKARSGSEALDLLLKNDVAVVLTDVSMPGMDGFELADTIRQHPRFQQMPLIFISAVCVSDLDRLKGYQTGAVDYISVPIIPELLRAKVSVFAELHRRAQQLETLNRELRRLSNSLIAAQDHERRRIARAMHDGLGQELTAAKMVLDGFLLHDEPSDSRKTLAAADASAMIERALLQVRSISHLLHLLCSTRSASAPPLPSSSKDSRSVAASGPLSICNPRIPQVSLRIRDGRVSHRPGGLEQCFPPFWSAQQLGCPAAPGWPVDR